MASLVSRPSRSWLHAAAHRDVSARDEASIGDQAAVRPSSASLSNPDRKILELRNAMDSAANQQAHGVSDGLDFRESYLNGWKYPPATMLAQSGDRNGG